MKLITRNWTRRGFLGATVATAAAGLFSPALAQDGRKKVRAGFSGINEYTGLFVATEAGIFAKNGLDVEPMLMANNSVIPSALMSGSIEVGTPGINIFLVAIDAGLPLQIICGAGVLSARRPTMGVLARTGSGIQSASDFVGKRVVVPGLNNGFHVIAQEWLRQNGEDPTKVNWVEGSFAQMPDLLRGAQVDAVVAGEPIRGRIIAQELAYAVGETLKAIRDPAISGTYGTTATYAEANPDVLAAFRASITEAHGIAKADPAGVLEYVGKYLKMSVDDLKKIPSPNLEANIDPDGLAYWIDVMLAQNLIKERADPATLIAS